jgi:hypothetical protein
MLLAMNVLPLQLPDAEIVRPGMSVPLIAPRAAAFESLIVMRLRPCAICNEFPLTEMINPRTDAPEYGELFACFAALPWH